MITCLTIKSTTVEALRVLFYGWVLRDTTCGKAIIDHNVSCGSQGMYGTLNRISFAHDSGSNPNFITDPHIRSVPFVIDCKLDISKLKTVHPFLQVHKHKKFHIDPCTINMCTKLYGTGGTFSDIDYIRTWMKHMGTIIDMVTIYVLDSKVPLRTLSFLQSYPNVNLIEWNSSFTEHEYKVQTETAASEIEGIYRSAIDHCAMQSVSKFGWVLITDLDEVLYVPKKKRLCQLQQQQSMITFPILQRMSNTTICPYMYDVAKNASNNIMEQYRIRQKSKYFHDVLSWKGMMKPKMKSFYFAAHISNGLLTSPDVAFLTHRNHRSSCQDQCCCHNSSCDFVK